MLVCCYEHQGSLNISGYIIEWLTDDRETAAEGDCEARGLVDNGYVSGNAIERIEDDGVGLYVPVTSEDGNNEQRYDYRPPREPKKKTSRDKRLLAMKAKMEQDEAQRLSHYSITHPGSIQRTCSLSADEAVCGKKEEAI